MGLEKDSRGSIAIVDDDDAMLSSLKRILSFYGFKVHDFSSGEKLLDVFTANTNAFETILTDLNMPGIDGLELTERIKGLDKDASVILLSGFPSSDNKEAAQKSGALDFLEKPCSNDQIVRTLDKGIALWRKAKTPAHS